jgi:hypothetical protein
MWDDYRHHHEPGVMSTDDLVACYGLAGRLRQYEHEQSLDGALRLWMFAARKELESRGELERVREWLPVYFDPTRRNPVSGPGTALAGPVGDEKEGLAAARRRRQIVSVHGHGACGD